ncbi:MAG: fatty acid desaturase [Planctomycetota bacterium]
MTLFDSGAPGAVAPVARNMVDEMASWKLAIADHKEPVLRRSIWQLVNTLGGYLALWVAMVWVLPISYWLVLPLAVVAGGFMVRTFIIFHDCTHGSFFRSRRANTIVGYVTGILTLTPFEHWRRAHAIHHQAAGDLDRRGTGDVWTLTVEEYLSATRWKRFAYRLARNPVVLFVLAPFFLFLVDHRIPVPRLGKKAVRSVLWTNAALAVLVVVLGFTIGFKAFLLIQLPVLLVAGSAGVWLFYVQHQFEGVYWERGDDWEFVDAALQGSSFYKLPRLLQWFSGNIGFHHLHHLSPTIPNYNLERCHHSDPRFQEVKAITLLGSLKSLSFRLWDEKRRTLISYRGLRAWKRERSQSAASDPSQGR